MSSNPWDRWPPGVLSKEQIKILIELGYIRGIDGDSDDIDYSSFDLHVSDICYKMNTGCIKPFGGPYETECLKNNSLATEHHPDSNGNFLLKKEHTYVFKLKESIYGLDGGLKKNLVGYATGKSTIGRVDVLTRLITDGMEQYDKYDPEYARGDLFLEATPITFNVYVKEGKPISQLRLFWGPARLSNISSEEKMEFYQFFINRYDDKELNSLSVDLSPIEISEELHASAFCALDNQDPFDLWVKKDNKPNPAMYWKPIESHQFLEHQDLKKVNIKQNKFYILRSRERIRVPEDVAVYCRAMDEALGEMRIHYAGFVHPHFGCKKDSGELEGTPLTFEMRGHNVNINLTDGETLAKLMYYQMSQPAIYEKGKNPYNKQELKLSKIFDDWPSKKEFEEKQNASINQAE